MGKVISTDNAKQLKDTFFQYYEVLLIESERILTNFNKGSTDMNQLNSKYYKNSSERITYSTFIKEKSSTKEIEETEKKSLETLL